MRWRAVWRRLSGVVLALVLCLSGCDPSGNQGNLSSQSAPQRTGGTADGGTACRPPDSHRPEAGGASMVSAPNRLTVPGVSLDTSAVPPGSRRYIAGAAGFRSVRRA
jgi:hypothetical protein